MPFASFFLPHEPCPSGLHAGLLLKDLWWLDESLGSQSGTLRVFTQLDRNGRIFFKPWHLSLQPLSPNSGTT